MRPRPRSRKKPVELVPLESIAAEVERIRADQRVPPVAIVAGYRDWQMARRLVDQNGYIGYWPGGEMTFLGVPVIVTRALAGIEVVATQPELDELILGT